MLDNKGKKIANADLENLVFEIFVSTFVRDLSPRQYYFTNLSDGGLNLFDEAATICHVCVLKRFCTKNLPFYALHCRFV